MVSLADPDQKAEEKLAGTLDFRSGGIYREAAAVNGECRIQSTGSYQICDQAFKVSGIEDNGAAGYYEEHGKQCFIFAPVLNGTMYFQSNGDRPSTIWCGNLFISNRKELRMTPVLSGISPGEKPFLEIHNPTEESVSAVISSPPGAPYFGGTEFQVRVPAGQSLIQKLEVKNDIAFPSLFRNFRKEPPVSTESPACVSGKDRLEYAFCPFHGSFLLD